MDMDERIRYQGWWFGGKEIDEIREIIATHPDKSRWFLSREICRQWVRTQPNGVLKDMVCRGLWLRLASGGFIQLPPCRRKTPYFLANRKKSLPVQIDQSPLQGILSEFKPIELVPVRRTPLEGLYRGLIGQYHYLGYTRPVGAYWVLGSVFGMDEGAAGGPSLPSDHQHSVSHFAVGEGCSSGFVSFRADGPEDFWGLAADLSS